MLANALRLSRREHEPNLQWQTLSTPRSRNLTTTSRAGRLTVAAARRRVRLDRLWRGCRSLRWDRDDSTREWGELRERFRAARAGVSSCLDFGWSRVCGQGFPGLHDVEALGRCARAAATRDHHAEDGSPVRCRVAEVAEDRADRTLAADDHAPGLVGREHRRRWRERRSRGSHSS
jgi:hypothetical protein